MRRSGLDKAYWTLAAGGMALLLLAPALWNGFPLIYPDTGGYLMRPLSGTLEMGRSALYGAFLLAGASLWFWPNVLAQALAAVWLIALILRAHGLGNRPGLTLAMVLLLALTTSLPFFASQLMPDIFFPLAVLAIYLLAFHARALAGWERGALCGLIVFALASHMALLGLALGLLAVFLLLSAFRFGLPKPHMTLAAIAIAFGLLMAPLSNLMIAGKFAFTPGGSSFLFNRLVEDGIVSRYLDARCPDPGLRLCAYKNDISRGYDDWLWANDTPFWKLGGWQDYSDEERRIILATLMSDPLAHLATAASATFGQFVSFSTEVATGREDNSHTIETFERRLPRLYPALKAARQQTTRLDVSPLNVIHVPVAALSMLALAAALMWRRRIGLDPAQSAFAATILLALLINAAVCGIFSHPADRYQSRLAPLAPLALIVLIATRQRPKRLSS